MENTENMSNTQNMVDSGPTKFCKHCGGKIPQDAVICVLCGRQVEVPQQAQQPQQIIVNNSNVNTNTNNNNNNVGVVGKRLKNKWVAFALCFFLGYLGAHKFYEEKIGLGIVYLLTFGLFGIGWVIDIITILLKPNPYIA